MWSPSCSLLTLFVFSASASRISERFVADYKSIEIRYLLWAIKGVFLLEPRDRDDIGWAYYNVMCHPWIGLNVTEKYIETTTVGSQNSTGDYDGVLGYIQRNEADTTMMFLRPDGVSGEPFWISSAVTASDGRIYSQEPPERSKSTDVTDVARNFSHETYLYLVISVLIAIPILVLGSIWESGSNVIVLRRLYRFGVTNSLKVCRLLLHQDYIRLVNRGQQFLWHTLNLAIFVVVFGYICNLMSSDLVVYHRDPVIERLEDFTKEEFQHLTPVIFRDFNMYDFFKSSPKDSLPGRLLKDSIDRNGLIQLPSSGGMENAVGVADNALNYLFKNLGAICAEELWVRHLVSLWLCVFKTEVAKTFHESKEGFGTGIMTTALSKSLPPQKRELMEYKLYNYFEFGILTKSMSSEQLPLAFQMSGSQMNQNISECLNAEKSDRKSTTHSFPLKPFRTTLTLSLIVVCFAFIVLIAELIWKPSYAKMNKLIRRKRRKHRRVAQRTTLETRKTTVRVSLVMKIEQQFERRIRM